MTIQRPFWVDRIRSLLRIRPLLWIAGVRRTGKTTLVKSIEGAQVLNCDLPRIQEAMKDPELFLRDKRGLVVFDEIHQLDDPALVLKIAHDEFPLLKVIATGSSTLWASAKFSDTLTDRKRTLLFPPVLATELGGFGIDRLEDRLVRGGCPPALLRNDPDPEFYAEWLDSFYSRDIETIFHVEKKKPFLDVLKFLLRRNGGQLEVVELARESGVSRPTAVRYLEILETAQAIRVLPPWSQKGAHEIVSMPKVYGFDTGFVVFVRGHGEFRHEDGGGLLENLVLDLLLSVYRKDQIFYWRTKTGQEVDFVLKRGSNLDLIEVKWSRKAFEAKGMHAFRSLYPGGRNFLVAADQLGQDVRKFGGIEVIRASPVDFRSLLAPR